MNGLFCLLFEASQPKFLRLDDRNELLFPRYDFFLKLQGIFAESLARFCDGDSGVAEIKACIFYFAELVSVEGIGGQLRIEVADDG